jgi:hypothetical protein
MINYKNLPPSHRSTYAQLRGLIDLLLQLPGNLVWAEIGCYDGASAELWMLRSQKLYCIDPWFWTPQFHNVPCAEIEGRFDERMRPFGDRVIKIKGNSWDIVDQIPDGSLDGFYLDASHVYQHVKLDLEKFIPKVKDSGWVTGHDWQNPDTPGVEKAIREVIGEPDIIFQDWSWIYRYERGKK